MLKIYLVLVLLVQPLSFSFSTSAFQFQPSLFSVSALCLSVSAPLPFSFSPLSFLFQHLCLSVSAPLPFSSSPLSFLFQPFSTSLFFSFLFRRFFLFVSVQRLFLFCFCSAPPFSSSLCFSVFFFPLIQCLPFFCPAPPFFFFLLAPLF